MDAIVPLTPDPTPPFHGGEGGFGVFEVQWKKREALAATGGVRSGESG